MGRQRQEKKSSSESTRFECFHPATMTLDSLFQFIVQALAASSRVGFAMSGTLELLVDGFFVVINNCIHA